jgi:hypothetical protein
MISVIMYGRNDNHGYNYHKRAAVSINCIAEILSDSDEILFVDCNSAEEFPTLPQAIQDTFTEKAKKKLKIIRIKNPCGSKYLTISESYSRNVAIRKSNPLNKWILSTNSDMIFFAKDPSLSLTELVKDLKDGFYSLPRFAIPENLWEQSFDRTNPRQIINFLRDNSERLHLHTTVRRPGFLAFDNPGDFQLMLRSDAFEIGGFDESMIKGWHVDANMCKRMELYGRPSQSLEDSLLGFHCNHNLKESLFSKKTSENCWSKYVANVTSHKLDNKNWGVCSNNTEMFQLDTKYIESTLSIMRNFKLESKEIFLSLENFNSFFCKPSSSFIYIADLLSNLPCSSNVSYFGYNCSTLAALSEYFEKMNFLGSIYHNSKFSIQKNYKVKEFDKVKNILNVHTFIFDFSLDPMEHVNSKVEARKKIKEIYKFYRGVKKSCWRMNITARFVGINVLLSDFNTLFSKGLHLKKSDYSTGVAYGFLLPNEKKPKLQFLRKLEYIVTLLLFDYCEDLRRLLAKNMWTKKLMKSLQ